MGISGPSVKTFTPNHPTGKPASTRRSHPVPLPAPGSVAVPADRRQSAACAVAVAGLDTNTKHVSTPEKTPDRRGLKWALREALWQVSTLNRVASCGRRRISKAEAIRVRTAEGTAHYTGVQLCGSIHSCPVCSAKIRADRAAEIELGLRTHLARQGGAEFLTLTLPHHVGDRLKPLLKAVAKSFRRVLGGRGWTTDRSQYAIKGTIRVLETTHGPNSWHPHVHVLLLTERPLSDQERADLLARMYTRWSAAVEASGYAKPLPGLCQMEPVRRAQDVAGYLAKVQDDLLLVHADQKPRKVGNEMARSDLKQGRQSGSRTTSHRTPFQVLADFTSTGDCADLELWHEWEQGSRGHQCITWSRGLKASLGVAERTDEEITEEEIGGEDVLAIRPEEWHAITSTPGAALRVLVLVEQEGALAALVFIQATYRRWAEARMRSARPTCTT